MSRAIPSLSCVHMTRDKGICHVHGSGARKSWKPSTKKIVGPDGMTTTRYTRRYFYVCDVGPKRGKMIHQKLSFSKTTESSKTEGTKISSKGCWDRILQLQWGSEGTSVYVWLELIAVD